MDNAAQFVTILVGLGIVTALVASTYVLFRASLSKARIDALREDNDDLRKRIDDQDKELIKCEAREKALEETAIHLREENSMLKELVLQRAEVGEVQAELIVVQDEVVKLFKELTSHHKETIEVLTHIKEGLENV